MSKRPRRNRPPTRRPGQTDRPSPSTDPSAFAAGDTTPSSEPGPAPAATGPSTGGRSASTPRPARPTRRTTRATRRVEPRRSAADRYRGLLLGVFALLGAGLIGFVFIQQTGAAAYTCATLMTPGPAESLPTPTPTFRPTPTGEATASASASADAGASPGGSPAASDPPSDSGSPGVSSSPGASAGPSAAPSASPSASAAPSPRLGFPAADLGTEHVAGGSNIRYAYCPPTSGDHYNAAGQGPIRREFYGPETERAPGGWIHNLEHGYVVLAYRGGEGQAPSEEVLSQMRDFFENAPASTFPNSCPSVPNKVLVVRFDEMETPFAMLAWDRALMMDTFDPEQALTFYEQWVDDEALPEAGAC